MKPREWQIQFIRSLREHRLKFFTLHATPRAGKTLASAMAFRIDSPERYDKMIVVGPTREVRRQWVRSSAEVNVQLCELSGMGAALHQYDGIAMTYQQLSTSCSAIDRYCKTYRVFLVLDEPHHLAEKQSWGASAIKAFTHVQKGLLVTGTPFRSDKHKIPFAAYEHNRIRCDHSYVYGQAVTDKVCREIKFEMQDGEISWRYVRENCSTLNVEEYTSEISATATQAIMNQRLRAALDPEKGLLLNMQAMASERLNFVRKTHKNAGGLVVCYDIEHAKKTAALIENVTGEKPVVITSEGSKGSESIEKFRRGSAKWIVSVQMISEGVDIKRLRVLVFATVMKTRLGFRQLVARVGTIDGEHDGPGYVFLPRDPDLARNAKEMQDEVIPEACGDLPLFGKKNALGQEKEFESYVQTLNVKIQNSYTGKTVPGTELSQSLARKVKEMRQDIHSLVNKYAKDAGLTPREINAQWLAIGGGRAEDATIDQLRLKLSWITGKINKIRTLSMFTPSERIFSCNK